MYINTSPASPAPEKCINTSPAVYINTSPVYIGLNTSFSGMVYNIYHAGKVFMNFSGAGEVYLNTTMAFCP